MRCVCLSALPARVRCACVGGCGVAAACAGLSACAHVRVRVVRVGQSQRQP